MSRTLRKAALALIGALCLFPVAALGQANTVTNWQTGTTSTGAPINAPVSNSNPLPVTSTNTPATRTIVPLDISTVTTGGTAVTALNAGHRTEGGFIYNPFTATIPLCINEQGTASGTTSSGNTTCIQPGQTYILVPTSTAVSVISSDSSHPFSGEGLN